MRTLTHALTVTAFFLLAGCASMERQDPTTTAQEMEPTLEAAGFQRLPANTPEKMAHLKTLPPLKLIGSKKNGKKQYVFADPYYCQCMYVGDWNNYQRVKRDRMQQDSVTTAQDTAMMDDSVDPEDEFDPLMDPFGPFAF